MKITVWGARGSVPSPLRPEEVEEKIFQAIFGLPEHLDTNDRDEVREYMPGDDVRSIDWNVTARTGKPHIKRYVEERELTVMLLVDLSASQRFGTREAGKQELAAAATVVVSRASPAAILISAPPARPITAPPPAATTAATSSTSPASTKPPGPSPNTRTLPPRSSIPPRAPAGRTAAAARQPGSDPESSAGPPDGPVPSAAKDARQPSVTC